MQWFKINLYKNGLSLKYWIILYMYIKKLELNFMNTSMLLFTIMQFYGRKLIILTTTILFHNLGKDEMKKMKKYIFSTVPNKFKIGITHAKIDHRRKVELNLHYVYSNLYTCKIQKKWCTVTVAPIIQHQRGHSRTPANQRRDQVPGRSQRLLLGDVIILKVET